jgi:beta-phosphoglucomutase-like phosphatase (HAD superfamily)
VIRAGRVRSRPAPDAVLAACRRLDVEPSDTVALTQSAAGVAASRAAGVTVIGIGAGAQAETLRGLGAERVVPSLAALLDPRLAANEHPRR